MKAAKVIVIILGVVAAVFVGWKVLFAGGSSNLPNSYPFVDIETGVIKNYALDSFKSLPGENSRNGKATILPVFKDKEGVYRVPERYRSAVTELAKSMEVKVNLDTWEIVNP